MDDADERLFRRIMNNNEHVLQPFLPDRPDLSYNLRRRPHCNKSLITKTVDLSNNDYNYHTSNLQRQLLILFYTKTILPLHFYLFYISLFSFFLICIKVAFVNFFFNKREMMMMMNNKAPGHLVSSANPSTALLVVHACARPIEPNWTPYQLGQVRGRGRSPTAVQPYYSTCWIHESFSINHQMPS